MFALLVLAVAVSTSVSAGGTAETAEVEPIKVGGIFALTGYMAEDAISAKNGFLFAVDEINDNGGLLGRPLEPHIFDIGDFAPETLMLSTDELVGIKGVDAIFGGWSGWGQDVRACAKYDVPSFLFDFSGSTTEALQEPGSGNVFHLGETEAVFSKWHWAYLMSLPYEWPNKKLALIGEDGSWGRGVNKGITEEAEADGWEVVVSEIVPYGTVEWGPILTKVRATEPALLYFEVPSAPEAISFFRQFIMDPTPTVIDYGWTLSVVAFMREMGEEANGLLGEPGGWIPLPPPTPEAAEFVERVLAKYGPVMGEVISAATADVTYTEVMMWAEAVRQVGDPSDHEAIVQWIKDTPYQAMPGMRTFDFVEPNILLEADYQLSEAQVQNGQFYTLLHKKFGEPIDGNPYFKKYVDYQDKSYEFQIPPWIE